MRFPIRTLTGPVAILLTFCLSNSFAQDSDPLLAVAPCPDSLERVPPATSCVDFDAAVLQDIVRRPLSRTETSRIELLQIDDETIVGIVIQAQAHGNDMYTLSAAIAGDDAGRADFAIAGDIVVGSIVAGGRVLEFSPSSEQQGITLMSDVDVAALPRERQPQRLDMDRVEEQDPPFPVLEMERDPSLFDIRFIDNPMLLKAFRLALYNATREIKVLSLYPRQDYPFFCMTGGSIWAWIARFFRMLTGMLLSNSASNVYFPYAEVEVVVDCVNYQAHGEDLTLDMHWLRTGHAKTSAELQAMGLAATGVVNPDVYNLRIAHKADLVNLTVPYVNLDGDASNNWCGWAMMPSYPDHPIPSYMSFYANNAMYSVSVKTCMAAKLTFEHEISHHFGMDHDRGSSPNNVPNNCGYGYVIRDKNDNAIGSTVMTYEDSCIAAGGSPAECKRRRMLSTVDGMAYYSQNVPGSFDPGLMPVVAGIACGRGLTDPHDGSANNSMRLFQTAWFVSTYDVLIDSAQAVLP